jgi:acyl-CoA synthetase (AMP-forming)/AMP-acid ligase II
VNRAASAAAGTLRTLRCLNQAGMLRPGYLGSMLYTLLPGQTRGSGMAAAALWRADEPALIDDAGVLSHAEHWRRTRAIASGLRRAGVVPGQLVALLCRNHRYLVEGASAAMLVGADVVFMNTAFAAPQLADVIQREQPAAFILDEEFLPLLADPPRLPCWIAWHDGAVPHPTLEALAAAEPEPLPPAPRLGRPILLTSGTTGTPKGARSGRNTLLSLGLGTMAQMLTRLGLRVGDRTLVASPAFHSWGLAHISVAQWLASTIVLQRRFDPEETLRAVARHRATGLVLVPILLQRILALGPEVIGRHDTSSLRFVGSSGSALSSALALRWMDTFGDTLHNVFGSTEVGTVSLATPYELRHYPGTAGRPPEGIAVRILDDEGRELPTGSTGRIFVRSPILFGGYTGGGSKPMVDGFMSIGDLGRFDEHGQLYVAGRDDEMIVSGAENVFPIEIEHLLAGHPEIAEVAVIGVPDAEYGQRLRAIVVRAPGSSLAESDVQSYVRERLARYKVPRDVHFVDALPRTATGKVIKRQL